MERKAELLYRQFEIQCSKERLIELSEWLNGHLMPSEGEDYDKIPTPVPSRRDESSDADPDWEAIVCKTKRETLANYLEWMADYIEAHRDGKTKTDNRVRITRNIAKDLRK